IIPYRGSWLDFEFDSKDYVYFRIDRRRKMPVTTLLKAMGFSSDQILAEFFEFDRFTFSKKGIFFGLQPERLRGELANFDIVAPDGKIIVQKDKRITAKHVRDLQQSGMSSVSVPEEFLLGKILAKDIVDKETGEVIALANSEINEVLLANILQASVKEIDTLFVNDLNHGPYISQTLRIDECADAISAQVAIYRMMRPGEPPTEEAVAALF